MWSFSMRSCATPLVLLATACADRTAAEVAASVDTDVEGEEPAQVLDVSLQPGGASPPVTYDDGCDQRPMFLLAGQSNMEGNVSDELFGKLLDELGKGPDEDLRSRLLAALNNWYFEYDDGYASYGYTDEMADLQLTEMIAYRDQGLLGADFVTPLPDTYCAFNDAPIASLELNCGYPFGPELMLGHARAAAGHSSTSYIKVARGGSTLFTDWRSPSSGQVGADYELLQERIGSLAMNPAGVHPACAVEDCYWAAFIWFQGENDSFDQAQASAYEANLGSLLADVRAEVGDPELPVIVVQTGAWAQSLHYGRKVAAAQQRVVDQDAHAQLVVTDDLSGFYHYDPAAQLVIGKRIADALESVLTCD